MRNDVAAGISIGIPMKHCKFHGSGTRCLPSNVKFLGSPSQPQVPADSEVRQVVKFLRAAAIGRHDMGISGHLKKRPRRAKSGFSWLFDGHLMGVSHSKRVVAW